MKLVKHLLILSILGLLLITFVGCTKKKEDANKDEQKSQTLVIYSPHKDLITDPITKIFSEKTGIKTEIITAGTGELLARLKTEADNPNADVFWGAALNSILSEKDLFQPYVSINDDKVEEQFRNIDGYITRDSVIPSVILINTKTLAKVTDASAQVTGYQSIVDLAKKYPKLKGAISTADPSKSSSAYEQLLNQLWAFAYIDASAAMGKQASVEDITQQYLDEAWDTHMKEFISVYDSKHSTGSGAVIADVVNGETAIGLTHEGGAVEAVANSSDVVLVYPEEGTIAKAIGASIIKNAKNVENAKLFIDFLLTLDAQNYLKNVYRRAVIKDADFSGSPLKPLSSFRVIQDNENLNNKEKMLAKYSELF